METQKNKVATVRKEGVLAKLTESRPKRLMRVKGWMPLGGLSQWFKNIFGWLWINDNGKTIFDKTPKSELYCIKPQRPSEKQGYVSSEQSALVFPFGFVSFEEFDYHENPSPSSSSLILHSPPPERHKQ